MDQYCVVVCGLRAGASDEASAWAPVAAALRMEQDEFARRVLAALPRVVRQRLDLATAERIAQLLQGMHVDARALPDDARLAYIERDGRSRGPLPQSALDMFIEPGEPYRLQGSHAWETWPEPPEHETTIAPAQAFDEAVVAPVDELPVEAPADQVEGEAEAPPTEDNPPASMPPLPTEPSPPEASAPTLDDEVMADDALINPAQEEEGEDSATAEELAESPAEAGTDQPPRSRYGRLLLLLVIAGVAAWAYLHWMADSRVDDTPPPAPVAHASHPADNATTGPGSTTSVGAAPVPAASAAAAGASPTPAPATSAPAAGGTATLPAAASIITAPAAAASAAPAPASSAMPATATSAPPAHAGNAAAMPAAARSSPQG